MLTELDAAVLLNVAIPASAEQQIQLFDLLT